MERKITVTGANKVFLTFTILFILFQIVLGILTVTYGENFLSDNFNKIMLVNQYILILIPVLGYIFLERLNLKDVLRLNRLEIIPAVLIVLMSVPASFVTIMINSIYMYLLQLIGYVPTNQIPVPQDHLGLITGIFIIAVSPAICEEILHRGILLKAYENRGSIRAIFITGIFFGIFHFDIGNLFGTMFLGMLIGYYVLKTNSIFAGMLAHFINNLIAITYIYFTRNISVPEKQVIGTMELGAAIMLGVFGLIIGLALLSAFNGVTEGKNCFKPPISSKKNDFVSVVSHWPIIIIITLYIFVAGLQLMSTILELAG